MAVTVVVELEVIDIDHHQRHRLVDLAGAPPFLLELAVEAAAVGEPGQAVEARQLLEVLVGDAQFLLAFGELLRHVVERGGKRLELRDPGLLRRAHTEIAASDAGCGAHQGADRLDDELLAAEPRHQQNEDAEQRELQEGDGRFMVDAGLHGALVEADGKARLRRRHARISEDTPDAVKTFGRHRALVAREHVMGQALRGERLADEVFLIGRAGDQRAAAVEQEDRGARALRGRRYQLADPLQVDHRKHDAADAVVVADHRKRGDEARPLMNPVDQVIAQREVTGMQRILKMRTIGHVQSDDVGLGRAFDAAVGAGDRQAPDPGHVAGERGQVLIAVRRLDRHLGIGAGDDLQERANGIDDLALRFRAATRQIDHFGAGAVDTMAARQVPVRERGRTPAARWPKARAPASGRGCSK